MIKQFKNLELTIPQIAAVMAPQKNKYLEWHLLQPQSTN